MTKSVESTYRALLFHVVVAMMRLDGRSDGRERKSVGDIYEEAVGFRLDEKLRHRLLTSDTPRASEVVDEISSRAHLLDASQRLSIFRCGLRVLRADGRAHSKELRFLIEIGLALGMSEAEIEDEINAF